MQPADPSELVSQDGGFCFHLGCVIEVLVVAAAAFAEVPAGRDGVRLPVFRREGEDVTTMFFHSGVFMPRSARRFGQDGNTA